MSYDPNDRPGRRCLAGNMGGETFREYCGLSPHRPFREDRRAYVRGSGVTAQALYRAIVAHGGPS